MSPNNELVRKWLDEISRPSKLGKLTRRVEFLRYLVNKMLSGQAADLNQMAIAQDFLGKSAPNDDDLAKVRNKAADLRKVLRKYYLTNGIDDEIVFELPKGGYVPACRAKMPNMAQHVRKCPDNSSERGVFSRPLLDGSAVFRQFSQRRSMRLPQPRLSGVTVEEYLDAAALSKKKWRVIKNMVDGKAWLPEWHQKIVLLAGQLANPRPLLKLLLQEWKDDYFCHRLCLAALCLPEIPQQVRTSCRDLIEEVARRLFQLYRPPRDDYGEAWRRESPMENSRIWEVLPHLRMAWNALGRLQQSAAVPVLSYLTTELVQRVTAGDSDALRMLALMYEDADDPPPVVVQTALDALNQGRAKEGAEALGKLGIAVVDYRSTIPLLLKEAYRGNRAAIDALRKLQAGTSALTRLLLESLRNGDKHERVKAAEVLGELGDQVALREEVVATLIAALGDGYFAVRHNAAKSLGKISHPTNECINALLSAVDHDEAYVRASALSALGDLGRQSARHPMTIPTILSSLRDKAEKDPRVAQNALQALGNLGDVAAVSQEVVSAVLAELDSGGELAVWAVRVLGDLGNEALADPGVIPALLNVLRNPDPGLRGTAVAAIGRLGPAAARYSEVIPSLLNTMCTDSEKNVKLGAASSIAQMGDDAAHNPEVISTLISAMKHESEKLACLAAETLWKLVAGTWERPTVVRHMLDVVGDDKRPSGLRMTVAGILAGVPDEEVPRRMWASDLKFVDWNHGAGPLAIEKMGLRLMHIEMSLGIWRQELRFTADLANSV